VKFEIVHKGEIETKELKEGSYKIGRSSACDIQLKSPQVSKNHALLVIKDNRAAIIDLGSSNGVFVNGILVRKQRIQSGDEVVISEFKIHIARKVRPAATDGVRGQAGAGDLLDGNAARAIRDEDAPPPEPPPALTPQEKLTLLMDRKVLMPFYGVMKTVDWRALLLGILGSTLVAAVLLSVLPVVRWGKNITVNESLARAHTVVTQTVRENYRVLVKTNDFSRLTVEACEAAKNILSCLVVDPKNSTVLSPVKSINQPVTDIYTLFAMKKISEGEDEAPSIEKDNGNYIVAEPIYLTSQNDKVLAGIVVAEFEIPAKVYSTFEPMAESTLFAILCSLAAYYLIFKMFTHPILSMQEQLDAALKGDDVTVTSVARSPELESLATVINFSISRMRQGGGGLAQPVTATDADAELEAYKRAVQGFDFGTTDGILLLDRDKRVVFVGNVLEDMLGMRNQYAQGQNISDACRDQSFAGTAIDMADTVLTSLGESQVAQLDVNGVSRNLSAVGHKNSGGELAFVFITVKMGGG
jgi:hypothetical protein